PSGAVHVSAAPLPTGVAVTTPGALGRPPITVTVKEVLVVKKPSVTESVITAVPDRPFSGVMRSVHDPEELHEGTSVVGPTGRSVVFDEETDTESADAITAPATVNETVTDPSCDSVWFAMSVMVGGNAVGGVGGGGGGGTK